MSVGFMPGALARAPSARSRLIAICRLRNVPQRPRIRAPPRLAAGGRPIPNTSVPLVICILFRIGLGATRKCLYSQGDRARLPARPGRYPAIWPNALNSFIFRRTSWISNCRPTSAGLYRPYREPHAQHLHALGERIERGVPVGLERLVDRLPAQSGL